MTLGDVVGMGTIASSELAALQDSLLQLMPLLLPSQRSHSLGLLADALQSLLEVAPDSSRAAYEVVWQHIVASYELEQTRPNGLSLLCAFLQPLLGSSIGMELVALPVFWHLVLHGFASLHDSLERKRAGHVIQTVVAVLLTRSESFDVAPNLFHWEPSHAKSLAQVRAFRLPFPVARSPGCI